MNGLRVAVGRTEKSLCKLGLPLPFCCCMGGVLRCAYGGKGIKYKFLEGQEGGFIGGRLGVTTMPSA